MNVVPLQELSLHPQHHLAALWWLGLLYRCPKEFRRAFGSCNRFEQITLVFRLPAHLLPYVLLLAVARKVLHPDFLRAINWHSIAEWMARWRQESPKPPVDPELLTFFRGTAAFNIGIDAIQSFGLSVSLGALSAALLAVVASPLSGVLFGAGICLAFSSSVNIADIGQSGHVAPAVFAITVGAAAGTLLSMSFGAVRFVRREISKGPTSSVFAAILSSLFVTALWVTLLAPFFTPIGPLGFVVVGLEFGIAVGLTIVAAKTTKGDVDLQKNGAREIWNRWMEFLTAAIILTSVKFPGGCIAVGIIGAIIFADTETSPTRNAICLALTVILGALTSVTFGVYEGLASVICCWLLILRLYYLPWHWVLLLRRGSYASHPVAWDDTCTVPFSRLESLIVSYHANNPNAADAEIRRLVSQRSSQRCSALRAKVIVIAQRAQAVQRLTELPSLVAELPVDGLYPQEALGIQEWATRLEQSQKRCDTCDRPLFRDPYAKALRAEVIQFRDSLTRCHEPLRTEFRKATGTWLDLAERQVQQTRAIMENEPILQVFRAGDPLNRNVEAFIPRMRVIGELESQIMLSTGCPGILVHGRRRMGKSTVLRNLAGFLPNSVGVVNISMQDPRAFTSMRHWSSHLCRALRAELGSAFPGADAETLPELIDTLAGADKLLADQGRRVLLAIDEYEVIDKKIEAGAFSKDLLATIRESIQTHRQITWIFAGVSEIERLRHADWTSYFVSLRTTEVLPFSMQETRLLLTDPLKHSAVLGGETPKRVRFDETFWGENGIERIQEETIGWPNFVQLLAEILVELVKDAGIKNVTPEVFEMALDKSIIRAHTVFHQLFFGESDSPVTPSKDERHYLEGFRSRDVQPPPNDYETLKSLKRRLMVIEEDGGCRLRIPLVKKWLRERA